MSFVRIWVHGVWGTKSRKPLHSTEIRPVLFDHIRANARTKGLYIDCVNGHVDHVHCVLSLNAELSISKTIQLIKGESSRWANLEKLTRPKLEWADEYFAASVSESMLDKVRAYISRQEEHHRKKTFSEEWEEFIKLYGKLGSGGHG